MWTQDSLRFHSFALMCSWGPWLKLDSLINMLKLFFSPPSSLCRQCLPQRTKNVNSHSVRVEGFTTTASPSSPPNHGESWLRAFWLRKPRTTAQSCHTHLTCRVVTLARGPHTSSASLARRPQVWRHTRLSRSLAVMTWIKARGNFLCIRVCSRGQLQLMLNRRMIET